MQEDRMKTEGEKIRKVTHIVDRRRKPGEVAVQLKAIRNFCLECMGGQRAEIDRCEDHGCWLYPYRFGTSPEAALKKGKEVL